MFGNRQHIKEIDFFKQKETERQIYLNRKREGNIDEEERTEERKGEKIIHPINSQQ